MKQIWQDRWYGKMIISALGGVILAVLGGMLYIVVTSYKQPEINERMEKRMAGIELRCDKLDTSCYQLKINQQNIMNGLNSINQTLVDFKEVTRKFEERLWNLNNK